MMSEEEQREREETGEVSASLIFSLVVGFIALCLSGRGKAAKGRLGQRDNDSEGTVPTEYGGTADGTADLERALSLFLVI